MVSAEPWLPCLFTWIGKSVSIFFALSCCLTASDSLKLSSAMGSAGGASSTWAGAASMTVSSLLLLPSGSGTCKK